MEYMIKSIKMQLPKNKIFIPFLLVLISAISSTAIYFLVTKKPSFLPKPPASSREEEADLGEIPEISDLACLVVPKINPRKGAHKFKSMSGDVYEFYYRGKLLDAVSHTVNNCDYYEFKIQIKTTDYDTVFYLPKGLRGRGDFSSYDGQFIAKKKDQEIEIKIIYNSKDTNWKDLQADLQIVTWELIE